MVRVERLRGSPDYADRERGQRVVNKAPLAVFARVAAGGTMPGFKQYLGCLRERGQGSVAAFFPICALHDKDEIVAADMSDKIVLGEIGRASCRGRGEI